MKAAVTFLLCWLLVSPALATTATELIPWLDSVSPAELQKQLHKVKHVSAADNQGKTLLHHAICDAPASVPVLIHAGVSVKATDKNGDTALHQAFLCGKTVKNQDSAVTALIRAGAPVNVRDKRGRTPLWLAAANGSDAEFTLLLEHGAKPGLTPKDAPTVADRVVRAHDWQKLKALLPLPKGTQLSPDDATATLAAALLEDAPLDFDRTLDDLGAVPSQLLQYGGDRVAWHLAEKGRTRVLHWLLDQDFPLNDPPPNGWPPLFFASDYATALLLKLGADPSIPSAQHGTVMAGFIKAPPDYQQKNPHFTEEKVDRLLRAGYPVNMRDPQNKTALERAVAANVYWLVKRLLDAGADPTLTSDGKPSLVPLALNSGRLPMIRSLIKAMPNFARQEPGILVNYVRRGGHDPAVAELLLVNGIKPDAAGKNGNTALLWAARKQQWPLVKLLLDYGASPNTINASGCNLSCYTWDMPKALRQQVLRGGEPSVWHHAPDIDRRPAGFFALAMTPTLFFWLLVIAWQLYRDRGLLVPTGWLLLSLGATVALAGTLFYHCEECSLQGPWQVGLSAAFALAVYGLPQWWSLRRQRAYPTITDAGPATHELI